MGGGMMWGVGLLWLLGVVVRLDNLPRATTQRNHPQRRVGVSGDDRPVACRSISPSPQTDQACAQQTLRTYVERYLLVSSSPRVAFPFLDRKRTRLNSSH